MPTTGAISQARERLGEAPVKLLFEKVAGAAGRARRAGRVAGAPAADGDRRGQAGRAGYGGEPGLARAGPAG